MEAQESTALLSSSSEQRVTSGTSWSVNLRGRLFSLLLGQLLSLLICLSAVISVYLTSFNLYLPTTQNFLFYLVLSAIFTPILACRPDSSSLLPVLRVRGWKYFLVAVADAEANYLVVKAYQYTTLTSVQLLDCFTIPTVLLLSKFLLRVEYRWIHIGGVVICLCGVACLAWADVEEGIPDGQGEERLLGDFLCLAGASLYGVSNVAQEFLVKTFDMVEFLGVVGLFGSFVTGIQAVLLESPQITKAVISGSPVPLYLLLGYALTQLSFYILASLLMKVSGATVYNLSILTADVYSILVGILLFQYRLHTLYFISFGLVLGGVITFSLKPTGRAPLSNIHEWQGNDAQPF